mgnify:FL=1|tara:strand:- start:7962 stop:8132 length:171 start_codon:yes stop_codon:yes gene_type:complete
MVQGLSMTPGWKTSEFWVTVGTLIGSAVGAVDLPGWGHAVVVAAYGLARGLAKVWK